MTQPTSIGSLSTEILLRVAQELDTDSLAKFSRTSRRHFDVANDHVLWRRLYKARLTDTFSRIPDVRTALKARRRTGAAFKPELHPKQSYRALGRVKSGRIQKKIENSRRREAVWRPRLTDPLAPFIAQLAIQSAGDITASIRQLCVYRPATAHITFPHRFALASMGYAIQGYGSPVFLQRLAAAVLCAANAGLSIYAYMEAVDPPKVSWPHSVGVGALIGVVEGLLAYAYRTGLHQGAGIRVVTSAVDTLANLPLTAVEPQVRVQVEGILRELPESVIADLASVLEPTV